MTRTIFFLFTLLGLCGCQQDASQPAAGADQAKSGESVTRVAAIKPQRKSLERRSEQPGEIVALEETPIYARLAGYVQSVPVDIGDEVKQGQTMAVLSVPEVDQELKQKVALFVQANAQVTQAVAAVDVAKAAIDTAESKIAAAEAVVAKTRADLERWKSEFDRVYKLTESSAINRKVADETLNSLRAAESAKLEAEAQVKSVKAMLQESHAKLQAADADVKAARAKVDVAQADVNRLKAMLDYATIKAPFAGFVTQRNVHTGFYVQPATTGRDEPLFVVRHSETVRVVVNVPEIDAGYTNKDDLASIRVQALDNKIFTAPVTRTAKALDEKTRTLRTEIELDNSSGQLQPGMYCYASILVEKRPDVLAIPVAAVMYDQGKPMCAAIVDGRIVRKPLVLGLRAGDEVEVTSGLTADDTIVPKNPTGFKDEQRVEIAK